MANIALESTINTARSTSISGPSRKILDTKGPQGPRKVLKELQNVQPNKNVSFDDSTNGLLKPSSKKSSTQLNRGVFNTPAGGSKTSSKPKPSGIKSATRPKGNGIKIYADNNPQVSNSAPEVKNPKFDTPETKEYMPPCTDREWRIPLPGYVEKTWKMKPSFNIDYFSTDSRKSTTTTTTTSIDDDAVLKPIDELTEEVCRLAFPQIKEDVLNDDFLLAVDHDLLNMDAFALPSLPSLDDW